MYFVHPVEKVCGVKKNIYIHLKKRIRGSSPPPISRPVSPHHDAAEHHGEQHVHGSLHEKLGEKVRTGAISAAFATHLTRHRGSFTGKAVEEGRVVQLFTHSFVLRYRPPIIVRNQKKNLAGRTSKRRAKLRWFMR